MFKFGRDFKPIIIKLVPTVEVWCRSKFRISYQPNLCH